MSHNRGNTCCYAVINDNVLNPNLNSFLPLYASPLHSLCLFLYLSPDPSDKKIAPIRGLLKFGRFLQVIALRLRLPLRHYRWQVHECCVNFWEFAIDLFSWRKWIDGNLIKVDGKGHNRSEDERPSGSQLPLLLFLDPLMVKSLTTNHTGSHGNIWVFIWILRFECFQDWSKKRKSWWSFLIYRAKKYKSTTNDSPVIFHTT